MPLGPRERALYVRQITLPEIGPSGQRRLCDTRFEASPSERGRIAALYLSRAGLTEACGPQASAETPEPGATVEVRAPELSAVPPAVAVWLAGAFASVETIKAVLGVGRPGTIPPSLGGGEELP